MWAGANEMKTVVVLGGILIGLFFFGLTALYWLVPADRLPAFLPGYDPESDKLHVTHGLGMLVIGLTAFAMALARGWGD
jgi:hypothetical protein